MKYSEDLIKSYLKFLDKRYEVKKPKIKESITHIEIKEKYMVNRERQIITINGQEYKYNAFSILNDGVKIYRGNEIFVKF